MRILPLLLLTLAPSLAFATEVAVTIRTVGDVLRTSTGQPPLALLRQQRLAVGDIIETGSGAAATFKLADHSIAELGADSELVIADYQMAGNRQAITTVLLQHGQLTIQTGRETDTLQVITSQATIVGTSAEFAVTVTDADTRLVSFYGHVLISDGTDNDQPLLLDAQHSSAIADDNGVEYWLGNPPGHSPPRLNAAILAEADAVPVTALGKMPTPVIAPLSADGMPGSPAGTAGPVESFVHLVQNEQWPAARGMADELLERFEGLPRFDLYYGLLLVHEQAFDQAIFAFERVLIYYPQQHRARLELGRAYYHQQNYVRAQDALEQVLLAQPPARIAQAVRRLLAQNDAAQRGAQTRTELGSRILFGWDSNANLGGDIDDGDLDPNLIGLTDLADSSQAKSSGYVQWSLYTGLRQPTSHNSENHYRLDFTSKNYLATDVTDTSALTAMANLNLQNDKRRYVLPASTRLSWRGSEIWRSTTALGFSPQFRLWEDFWLGPSLATQIDLALNGHDDSAVKDSLGLELSVAERDMHHIFSSHYLRFRLAGQDDNHLEWQGLENSYLLKWRLSWRRSLLFSAKHQWRHYREDDPFFTTDANSSELKRRQDQVFDGVLNASWQAAPWLQTSLILEWHQVASNINAYSYRQWLASAAINIHF